MWYSIFARLLITCLLFCTSCTSENEDMLEAKFTKCQGLEGSKVAQKSSVLTKELTGRSGPHNRVYEGWIYNPYPRETILSLLITVVDTTSFKSLKDDPEALKSAVDKNTFEFITNVIIPPLSIGEFSFPFRKHLTDTKFKEFSWNVLPIVCEAYRYSKPL